jgi:hypothetical protein
VDTSLGEDVKYSNQNGRELAKNGISPTTLERERDVQTLCIDGLHYGLSVR